MNNESPQFPAQLFDKWKDSRRSWKFKSGLWVEISWHIGAGKWMGDAYEVQGGEYGSDTIWLGFVYSETRVGVPKKLRLAIAAKRNPKIGKVAERMKPRGPLIDQIGYDLTVDQEAVEALVKKYQKTFPSHWRMRK